MVVFHFEKQQLLYSYTFVNKCSSIVAYNLISYSDKEYLLRITKISYYKKNCICKGRGLVNCQEGQPLFCDD